MFGIDIRLIIVVLFVVGLYYSYLTGRYQYKHRFNTHNGEYRYWISGGCVFLGWLLIVSGSLHVESLYPVEQIVLAAIISAIPTVITLSGGFVVGQYRYDRKRHFHGR